MSEFSPIELKARVEISKRQRHENFHEGAYEEFSQRTIWRGCVHSLSSSDNHIGIIFNGEFEDSFHVFQMVLTVTIHGHQIGGSYMLDTSFQSAAIPPIDLMVQNMYVIDR